MKKLFFTFIFVSIVLVLFAQESKIAVGAHFAPTLSMYNGNPALSKFHESRFLYAFGADLVYTFSPRWSLRTGFEYEKKGTQAGLVLTDENGRDLGFFRINSSLDYVQIPLMFSSRLLNGKVSLSGSIGSYIGFLLQARSKYPDVGTFPARIEDHTDDFRKVDIGVAAALSLEFPLKKSLRGLIILRDNLGLTSLDSELENSLSLKFNSLAMQLGILQPI